ncbi:MAG: COX15/CtaA family protein [Pseudomonadota bacterium]
MDSQPLYDLTPLASLLLIGALVALGPLLWVLLRQRRAGASQRLRALTLVTLFLTFDLVLFGAFTRLTDSGLGCPDWPGCYGSASPVGAVAQISAAQAAMPTGPVTHGKAWVEMVHRYLASGVGALILVAAGLAWWAHFRQRDKGQPSPWWATLTLLWVCVQGAFGALTVTMKLFPAIVTLHLLGGMVLLALLAAQVVWQKQGGYAAPHLPAGLRGVLLAGFALLWLQIALGGWVSTNYAVLACTEFPACQGSLWPAMDFRQGFEVWRALGQTGAGTPIHFEALTAIHYVHRLMAYLVFAVLGLLAWRLHRAGVLQAQARWIAFLLLWQLASGLSNVVLGWPLVAAVAHTGGAAGLVIVLAQTLAASRGARTAVAHRRRAGAGALA